MEKIQVLINRYTNTKDSTIINEIFFCIQNFSRIILVNTKIISKDDCENFLFFILDNTNDNPLLFETCTEILSNFILSVMADIALSKNLNVFSFLNNYFNKKEYNYRKLIAIFYLNISHTTSITLEKSIIEGMINHLSELANDKCSDTKVYITQTILNYILKGEILCVILVENKIISTLIIIINNNNKEPSILVPALKCLYNLLKIGEELKTKTLINHFAKIFVDENGFSCLSTLTNHINENIQNFVIKIHTEFFPYL